MTPVYQIQPFAASGSRVEVVARSKAEALLQVREWIRDGEIDLDDLGVDFKALTPAEVLNDD